MRSSLQDQLIICDRCQNAWSQATSRSQLSVGALPFTSLNRMIMLYSWPDRHHYLAGERLSFVGIYGMVCKWLGRDLACLQEGFKFCTAVGCVTCTSHSARAILGAEI